VVRGVYRHILRKALHKPENYGKWTINIEIKEGEKRKREEKERGKWEKKSRKKHQK